MLNIALSRHQFSVKMLHDEQINLSTIPLVIYLLRKVWTSASVLQLAEGIQIVPRQTRCHDRRGTIIGRKPVEKGKNKSHIH